MFNKWLRSEDTLAVAMGLLIVGLSLSNLTPVNLLGWAAKTKEWVDLGSAVSPADRAFSPLTGLGSVVVTFLVLLGLLTLAVRRLGIDAKTFAIKFTIVYGLAFVCWLLGHHGFVAATPDKRESMGLETSLGLTGEAGYLLALIVGLLIGNFVPGVAAWLRDAARSELYIKTAIVIIGAGLGAKAAGAAGLTNVILVRGLAAIVEAYLIYWALVYFIARYFFKFSKEWAAPLAAGISICGVSAAITTGAAIRARTIVPVMVSSLVVVFSVMEMLVLPFAAREFLDDQPMVAAAWMGLSVKTDGAAISSGAITESLVYAKAAERGVEYQPGFMVLTTTTVKVFIDLFIGVWAVLLAIVWAWKIDRKPDAKGIPIAEIWSRFPKFVFGYVLTFALFLTIGLMQPSTIKALEEGTSNGNILRQLFFVLTFFSIGLASNFRRLWAEGLAKLALVYLVSLFGFVIWIGLAISWLFFHDVQPPLMK